MKKAAIYDPYLDTAGGGERYMLSAASALANKGWHVDLVWRDQTIKEWLKTRFGFDLSNINIVDDINKGIGYDLVFWLSDGSIPMLFGANNILHFQTPFKDVGGTSILNKLKLAKVNDLICNSQFTKRFIDKEYGRESLVLHPPVSTEEFASGRKENIILFVGRYSQLQQMKRQDVLVENFKKMCDEGLKRWRLVLIGGSEVGGRDLVKQLKNTATGYPVDVLENLPFDEVKKFYAKSKIFWSASGFGVREEEEPQKVEHFGMTVVEAQAAGCVPIVVEKGGHKEIILDGKNGFLWDSPQDLRRITNQLIQDERRREKIAQKAKEDCQKFSVKQFEKKFINIVEG